MILGESCRSLPFSEISITPCPDVTGLDYEPVHGLCAIFRHVPRCSLLLSQIPLDSIIDLFWHFLPFPEISITPCPDATGFDHGHVLGLSAVFCHSLEYSLLFSQIPHDSTIDLFWHFLPFSKMSITPEPYLTGFDQRLHWAISAVLYHF